MNINMGMNMGTTNMASYTAQNNTPVTQAQLQEAGGEQFSEQSDFQAMLNGELSFKNIEKAIPVFKKDVHYEKNNEASIEEIAIAFAEQLISKTENNSVYSKVIKKLQKLIETEINNSENNNLTDSVTVMSSLAEILASAPCIDLIIVESDDNISNAVGFEKKFDNINDKQTEILSLKQTDNVIKTDNLTNENNIISKQESNVHNNNPLHFEKPEKYQVYNETEIEFKRSKIPEHRKNKNEIDSNQNLTEKFKSSIEYRLNYLNRLTQSSYNSENTDFEFFNEKPKVNLQSNQNPINAVIPEQEAYLSYKYDVKQLNSSNINPIHTFAMQYNKVQQNHTETADVFKIKANPVSTAFFNDLFDGTEKITSNSPVETLDKAAKELFDKLLIITNEKVVTQTVSESENSGLSSADKIKFLNFNFKESDNNLKNAPEEFKQLLAAVKGETSNEKYIEKNPNNVKNSYDVKNSYESNLSEKNAFENIIENTSENKNVIKNFFVDNNVEEINIDKNSEMKNESIIKQETKEKSSLDINESIQIRDIIRSVNKSIEIPRALNQSILPEKQISDVIKAEFSTLKSGETKLEVVLNPESLGKVVVKLISESGRVQVEIVAEKPETQALLQNRAEQVGQALKQSGIELERYTVYYEQGQEAYYNQDGGHEQHQNQEEEQNETYNSEPEDYDGLSFSELMAAV